jgi:hypothetical protein
MKEDSADEHVWPATFLPTFTGELEGGPGVGEALKNALAFSSESSSPRTSLARDGSSSAA